MFEKQAKEYSIENYETCLYDDFPYTNDARAREQSFKDGAEFGYNKANEWHYPSKGEYPKCDEKTQLIFYVNCYYKLGDETVTIKRIVLGYYKKAFLRDDEKVFVEKSKGYEYEHLPQAVIAWKEIVPQKEIKEND